jgi:hypothetical protein
VGRLTLNLCITDAWISENIITISVTNVHSYIRIVHTNINTGSMTNSSKLNHKVDFC